MKQEELKMTRFLLLYFKRHYLGLGSGYLIMFCATALSLYLPIMIQNLINHIDKVNFLDIVMIFSILIISFVCQGASTYLFTMVGHKVRSDIQKDAWQKALHSEISYFDTIQSGRVSSKILNDTLSITNFVATDLPNMINGIVSLIVAISIMLFLDHIMTLSLIILIPCILLILFPIAQKISILSEKQQELLGKSNGYFSEIISQIRLIKAYGSEPYEQKRGNDEIDHMYQFGKKYARINAVLTPILGSIVTLLLLIVIGTGVYRISINAVEAGTIVAFLLYFYNAISPIQSLGSFLADFQDLKGRTCDLFSFINRACEDYKSGDTLDIHQTGDIKFENVCFSYCPDDQILKEISFVIKEGVQTAIIGESGSGKTTILSLLERFYIPQSGEIKIGDIPHEQISLPTWRDMFSYVSQDSIIVSGTIRENLLYGVSRDVADEELFAIARMADIYEFIMQQPNQLDSEVGERGVLMSGGQKQRIAIARAFIRNAKYLLLDEATANLDIATEDKVRCAIRKLQEGRTSIIITHKLSIAMEADEIILLQNGAVVARGTHQHLLKTDKYYANLAYQQASI